MTQSDLPKSKTAAAAIFEAQRLAFAPIAFHVARTLRDSGVLTALAGKPKGLDLTALQQSTKLSRYALRVLLEGGVVAGMLHEKAERYILSKLGFFVERDPMTRVNMDFVHDVCYQGGFYTEEALRTGTPAGLKVFGPHKTVYEALATLPPAAKKSWFAFDHYYSDTAFPEVLPLVFAPPPRTLFDIGGNTGRFATQCVQFDANVEVTILDLPGQLNVALANARTAGFGHRIKGHPIDFLDPALPVPQGADAIWMSQFLCCFSEPEVVTILTRVREAMTASTRLFILDTYWDRQKHDVARYCLNMSSLYFTVMANGNSRMYHSQDVLDCVKAAGLTLEQETDHLGMSHTLFCCRKR